MIKIIINIVKPTRISRLIISIYLKCIAIKSIVITVICSKENNWDSGLTQKS